MDIVYCINNASFFLSHRLPLAREALKLGYSVDLFAPSVDNQTKNILHNENVIYRYLPLKREKINIFRLIYVMLYFLIFSYSNKKIIYHFITIIPILICGFPARIFNRKCVFAVSGLGTFFSSKKTLYIFLRPTVKFMYKFIFNGINSRVIVQNRDDYKFFIENLKIHKKNLFLIKGSGADPKDFKKVCFYKKEMRDKKIILLPARLIREKGIFEMAKASKLLTIKGYLHEVWFAGEKDLGNPNSLSDKDISQLSFENSALKFLGYQKNIANLFYECDIVCLPTIYGEGLPKALIDAAACGKPIVTCDIPGCREIVVNEETGLLVSSNKPELICDAIERLFKDSKLAEKLGENAYNLFLNEFTVEKVVNETLKIYNTF